MDNRTILLNHTLRLFSARGYDAVGVQEICDAAGVTKPTLYHYFGSKRGLLEALMGVHFTRLNQDMAQAAEYHGDLPLTLTRTAAAVFSFANENPAFYRLQIALWFAPQDSEGYQVVAALNRAQFNILEDLFNRAAHDHGNMRGRQSAYAATFIGTLHTYVGMALNGHARLDAALVEQAVRQFQYGIYS